MRLESAPEPHCFSVRVYYEDTDFSGNVYHAAYLKFLERARTELLRARGVHHAELAARGLTFAVRALSVEFLAAAHIDDLLEVTTTVRSAGGVRLQLEQAVSRNGAALARAEVEVVAITAAGKPARLPPDVRAALG